MLDKVGRSWVLPSVSQAVVSNELGRLVSLTATPQNEIEQSIGIILMTIPGERVMRPDFGCRIHELVFSPNNQQTAVQAERFITEALSRWEPRIELKSVLAQSAHTTENEMEIRPYLRDNTAHHATLLITIQYRIRATNSEETLTFPYYLSPS